MSEQYKIASQNISNVFVQDDCEVERAFVARQLKKTQADAVFLAEAGHDQLSERLQVTLGSLGYTSLVVARTIDREDDIHAMNAGADIVNLIGWRDSVDDDSISELQLGVRSGFKVDLDGLPVVFTHFDDWSSESRREMGIDLLEQLGVEHDSPLVLAADMNASDKRAKTVAQRIFSSGIYRRVSGVIANAELPERLHRPVNIARRLGEIAGDDLIERLNDYGLVSVLPPEPTFDGRHAHRFGRKLQLMVDNILARSVGPDYRLHGACTSLLAQQPGQLDHAMVSAIIEI